MPKTRFLLPAALAAGLALTAAPAVAATTPETTPKGSVNTAATMLAPANPSALGSVAARWEPATMYPAHAVAAINANITPIGSKPDSP